MTFIYAHNSKFTSLYITHQHILNINKWTVWDQSRDTLRPEIYPELRTTAPINYQYYKKYDCCSKFHCTRRNGISGFSLPMTRYVDQIAENEGWETNLYTLAKQITDLPSLNIFGIILSLSGVSTGQSGFREGRVIDRLISIRLNRSAD